MIAEAFRLAASSILRNPLRSFLTILGIVIGVAAVIAMVTIGNGTTEKVTEQIGRLGSNMLFVVPGQMRPGRAGPTARAFTVRDADAIREQVPRVRAVAPVAQSATTVVSGGESRMASIIGTVSGYLPITNWTLAAGRTFTEGEERGSSVCLIGETVRSSLFGRSSPIGEDIRLGRINCEVVGLLEKKGQAAMGSDQDDLVILPLRTFQRRIAGTSDVHVIMVSAVAKEDTRKVQADIARPVRAR